MQNKYTFVRGNETKRQDTLDFKNALIEQGWTLEGDDNIDELKAKADELGIKYHHKAGVDKLKELINAHEAE